MERTAFKAALGRLIVTLRSELGLSQERLARDADIDRTRMGEIERGAANPTIGTLDKIARMLRQTLGALIVQKEAAHPDLYNPALPATNPRSVPGIRQHNLVLSATTYSSVIVQPQRAACLRRE